MLYTVMDGQIVELGTGRTISLAEEEERIDASQHEHQPAMHRMVDAVLDESRSQIASWGRL